MGRFFLICTVLLAFCTGKSTAGEIHNAARSGDVQRINQLLKTGADVNEASSFGTALHFAVIGNQIAAVHALIEAGADVDAPSEALGTSLHVAAQYGAADIASVLIKAGADVNARSKFEFTPLHTAAFKGSAEVAQKLLNAGADATALAYSTGSGTFESGYFQPLQLSEKHGHAEVSKLLRQFGGGPAAINPVGDLISNADPRRGRELAYQRCNKCHVLETGDPANSNNFGGPAIAGIFGQPVAAVKGFEYTPALKAFGGEWTEDRLFAWVRHPMLTVPGVRMPEVKQLSIDDVADVIAYLKAAAH